MKPLLLLLALSGCSQVDRPAKKAEEKKVLTREHKADDPHYYEYYSADNERGYPMWSSKPWSYHSVTTGVTQKKPEVHECFKVHELSRVDDRNYQMRSENTCPYEIEAVYVLVKFFDKDWNRIGVDRFIAPYVAPGERLKRKFPVPEHCSHYRFVGVRKITTNPGEALQ